MRVYAYYTWIINIIIILGSTTLCNFDLVN